MKKKPLVTSLYDVIVISIDIVLIIMSIYIAFMIVFKFNIPQFNYEPFTVSAPFIALAYLVFMHVFGLDSVLKQSIADTIYSIFLTICSLLIATMAINFFLRTFSYPRSVMLLSSLIQFIMLSLWRCTVWRVKRKLHGRKLTMIIGENNIDDIAIKIISKQRDIYDVKYIYSSKCGNLWNDINLVDVIFMLDDIDEKVKERILNFCITERKSLYVVPKIYDIVLLSSKLSQVDDIPVLKIKKFGLTIEQRIVKRLMDLVLSSLGLIILSPLMVLIAFLIKLDKGSVFYRQERITENNRKFNVIKFRTMIANAESLTGPILAGQDDPRITKVGKMLRRTRLDEIPQLINIFVGDMSIVGPRPERLFFIDQFAKEIPEFSYRTTVKAGLTGMAQVLGKYNTTAKDKLRYDTIYIKNYSVLLDLKIILQTIKIMFIKESSEGIKNDITLNKMIEEFNIELTMDIDN